jgi:hypothetical protein
MYRTNYFLNFMHALADSPPVLPMDILLTLPDYVTDLEPQEWLFNLPGAINDLMGSAGWERATQVMKPEIWAPKWTDEQLYDFAASPFGRNKRAFPKIEPRELRSTRRDYEIVHFVGNFLVEGNDVTVALGTSGISPSFGFEEFRDALLRFRTRLLILQHPGPSYQSYPDAYMSEGGRLAQALIAAGGPPVLVIASTQTAEVANRYLADVYAGIVHDWSLPDVARPNSEIEADVTVALFLGDGGEDILRLSRVRDRLYVKVDKIRKDVEAMLKGAHREALEANRPYLDVMSVKNFEKRAAELDSGFNQRAADILEKAKKVELDFNHETGGAIPLAEGQVKMSAIDKEVEDLLAAYPQTVNELKNSLNEQVRVAPRVLNAGFFNPKDGKDLGPRDPLIGGQEYDFLIDVGPKWNKAQSLVKGKEVFPEYALPPDETGYPVHVVFISDDLEPKFHSAWIYVPRQTGRSFPYDAATETKAEKSGPIAFRIKAPALNGEDSAELHGRLCLYYRNNLLQSARVYASVALTADFRPKVQNAIEVDYLISGNIQDLDALATRKLKFTPDEEPQDHPVTVNITLNDDGKEHRLVVRQLDELPAAAAGGSAPVGWTPFDADEGRKALNDAREALKACFFLRDSDTGEVMLDGANEPTLAVSESDKRDQNNRKSKEQFLMDLQFLAELGRGLFRKAFIDVRPEGNWATNAAWTNSLRKSLETSSIIQIARTGPANYVFPWSLIYQYPLPDPEKSKHCRVTNEWDNDGRRNKPLAKSCPFIAEPWHKENIFCPYGFWGLNHIIEQPLPALLRLPNGESVLNNVTDKILMGPTNLDLSIGITHDLSPEIVNTHLERLKAISPFRFSPPDPADDKDKVRSMLKAASVVYFLCHGEYDRDKKEPYLSIGLRDGKPSHRIYPGTLKDWADAADLTAWAKQRPLIFINGCHTTDLTPGEVVNFVSAFGFAGAAGVIGTEVSVLANVAVEIAESMFEKVVGPQRMPVGQAMYQTRWELANKGNLLGLAYTLYCLANLRVANN